MHPTSQNAIVADRKLAEAACGRELTKRSARTVAVVILDVLLQHRHKVAGSGLALANTASKAAVNLASRSRIRKRNWVAWSPIQ